MIKKIVVSLAGSHTTIGPIEEAKEVDGYTSALALMIKEKADRMKKVSALLEYLSLFREEPIERTVNIFFLMKQNVKKYTRRKGEIVYELEGDPSVLIETTKDHRKK